MRLAVAEVRVGRLAAREIAIVEVRGDHGVRGLGEASPLPGYAPELFHDALEELRSLAALASFEMDVETKHARADVGAMLARASLRTPSARCALETALLDALAHARGVPVHRLLRASRAGDAAPIPLNALIPLLPVEDALAAQAAASARGIRVVKAKVGRARFDDEVDAIRRWAREAAAGTELRLDANEAFSPDDVAERLERLAEAADGALTLVEQPVPREALFGLENAPVPLAADESLREPAAIDRLAGCPACRVVVLKPMVLGGALACLELAAAASARGLGVVVTHAFNGPVGHAAACELALSLSPAPLPCGLDRHALLDAGGHRVAQLADASVVPLDAPGLGVVPR
jgi:o-succinylbenzoate synthase